LRKPCDKLVELVSFVKQNQTTSDLQSFGRPPRVISGRSGRCWLNDSFNVDGRHINSLICRSDFGQKLPSMRGDSQLNIVY
jgi:hypothetical protein